MILLTPDLRLALRANHVAGLITERRGGDHDPAPVAKFFSPLGAATWLATELYVDGDTLFGLADLGFGCPELGTFSLSEIARVRLPFGLGIERDIAFQTTVPLSAWADMARRAGSILRAETIFRQGAAAPDPGFGRSPETPTDPEDGRGG